MKKAISLLLVLICGVTVFSSCKQTEIQSPAGMKKISQDAAGYIMYVPDEWTETEATGVTTATAGQGTATTVSAAKLEKPDGITDATVYFESYKEDFLKMMSDYQQQSEPADEVIDGVAAKRFTYTGTVSDKLRKYSMVIAVKDSSVYVLTFTSVADEYDTYYEAFQKIFTNFDIL